MKSEILGKLEERAITLRHKLHEINNRLYEESQDQRNENLVAIQALLDDKEKVVEELIRLEDDLQSIEVLENYKSFTIDLNGSLKDFSIVLPAYADPIKGLISAHSPLAKALENRGIGEIVEYDTPVGKRSCKIVSITYS